MLRCRSWVGVAAAVAATTVVLTGCAAPAGIPATGSVDATTYAVTVPILVEPQVNLGAGFSPPTDAQGSALSAPRPRPVVAVRIVDAVPLGTRVKRGDVVARIDSSPADAAVAVADADEALAKRRVELLAARSDEIADKKSDLKSKRNDIDEAIAKIGDLKPELIDNRADLKDKQNLIAAQTSELKAKRAELTTKESQLRSQRDQLTGQIAELTQARQALEQALQQTPDDPALKEQLQKVTAGLEAANGNLAQLTAGLKEVNAGLAQIDAGLAQMKQLTAQLVQGLKKLEQGTEKLDANLAKAREGRTKIDDGLSKLDDAATEIQRAKELAKTQTSSFAVAVDAAHKQQNLTVLVAPIDGVVVATLNTGDVVRPGAQVVAIRPETPASVTTWLPLQESMTICDGSAVSVATDWGSQYPAHVAWIAPEAQYPPTSQATDAIHLTRAVAVTVTVDADDGPPPGAPVDLIFQPCKES